MWGSASDTARVYVSTNNFFHTTLDPVALNAVPAGSAVTNGGMLAALSTFDGALLWWALPPAPQSAVLGACAVLRARGPCSGSSPAVARRPSRLHGPLPRPAPRPAQVVPQPHRPGGRPDAPGAEPGPRHRGRGRGVLPGYGPAGTLFFIDALTGVRGGARHPERAPGPRAVEGARRERRLACRGARPPRRPPRLDAGARAAPPAAAETNRQLLHRCDRRVRAVHRGRSGVHWVGVRQLVSAQGGLYVCVGVCVGGGGVGGAHRAGAGKSTPLLWGGAQVW
jgi:hypothetical protein